MSEQTTQDDVKPDEGQSLSTVGLERAARAVVREALDNVAVHPCDERNDEVRGNGLYGPMRDLYEALRSNVPDEQRATEK